MCRLLGVVASEHTAFRILLREVPRSLGALSREHKDGWGLAVFDAGESAWNVDKGVLSADEDDAFHARALSAAGHVLVSHVRKKTVGHTSKVNTHPFHRGPWIFAHNGTVRDTDFLKARTSATRAKEIEGDTDSELFFAFLLSRIDEAGDEVERVLIETMLECRTRAGHSGEKNPFGTVNFLLSDGETVYAHRFGRTLHLLQRGDAARTVRESSDGTALETPFSQRRHTLFIASEMMTDEPWTTLDDGVLVRIDRLPFPRWQIVG